jgi:hypothetical protein
MSQIVTPAQLEEVINGHIATQKQNPPDSDVAMFAAEANRKLFAYAQDMGWKYTTNNGYLTVIEG